MILDFVTDGRNVITLGAYKAVGLIITLLSTLHGPLPAIKVLTPDKEATIEISTYGAMAFGTGTNRWGNSGECPKSGGGSGKQLSWSTCGSGGGGSVNTGAILNAANDRFVNVSGDRMTGSLVIVSGKAIMADTLSGNTLKVLGSASGNVIHAEKTLTSSGTLVWEGAASGRTLTVSSSVLLGGFKSCNLDTDASGNLSCGTDADTSQNLFQTISVSGQSDVVADNATDTLTLVGGTNVTLTTNAGTDAVTIAATDTNTTYSAGKGEKLTGTVFSTNDTQTGSLASFQTVSGSTVYAKNTLTSSGGLKVLGNISGATLNVNSLKTCTNVQTDANGRASCNSTAYLTADQTKAGQGVGMAGTTVSLNASISGSLVRFTTVSGSLVFARTTLASSGGIVAEGTVSGATIGGFGLPGAGCNGSTQKVLYNFSTSKFECGVDLNTGGGAAWSNTGSLQTYFDPRYVNTSGDTMTGALAINVTGGNQATLGLRVINTASGAHLHAEKTLSSSGGIAWEGTASGNNLYVFGKLGIGTGSPAEALHVYKGTGQFSTIRFDSAATQGYFFAYDGDNSVNIGANSNSDLNLRVNNTNRVSFPAAQGMTYQNGGSADDSILTIKAPAGNPQEATMTTMINPGASATEFIDWTMEDYHGADNNASINIGKSGTGTIRPFLIRMWNQDAGSVTTVGASTGVLSIQPSGNVGLGTSSAETRLEVVGTISGTTMRTKNLFSSGAVVLETSLTGATIGGFGLPGAGCNSSTQKLLWNFSTSKFECGVDLNTGGGSTAWSNTGSLQSYFDNRFVNTKGDTMTGALTINLTAGTIGLNVLQTMSGNTLFVSKGATLAGTGVTISSTGSTVFNNNSRNVDFLIKSQNDTGLFFLDASADKIGIGTRAPRTKLEIAGSVSGATVFIGGGSSGQILVHQGPSIARWRWPQECLPYPLFGPQVQAVVGSGGTFVSSMSGVITNVNLQASGVASGVTVQLWNGSSRILSTAISTDNKESNSNTAATPAVINTATNRINQFSPMRIDVTAVGAYASTGVYLNVCYEKHNP